MMSLYSNSNSNSIDESFTLLYSTRLKLSTTVTAPVFKKLIKYYSTITRGFSRVLLLEVS